MHAVHMCVIPLEARAGMDALEKELQSILCGSVWVRRTERRSSRRAESAPNH